MSKDYQVIVVQQLTERDLSSFALRTDLGNWTRPYPSAGVNEDSRKSAKQTER